jgi:TPP-dependent pyruvate/acetoin dehydrogenase alpha subunit
MTISPAKKNEKVRSLDEGLLKKMYYYMLLNRALDERITALYRQGRFQGGAFVSRGQEATSVGSALVLEEGDVIGPMIRNSGAVLVRGVSPKQFLANYLGRTTGPTGGKDGNSHFGVLDLGLFAPISMLGALVPVCAGAALSFKMRHQKNVALTWIGDGGSSMGDFHEGLNFAAVQRLPLVVILENNGYAYSTPTTKQSLLKDFVKKAEAYGVPGECVDGNDVLAVYECTKRAVDRARSGGGPSLIESLTFRMRGHAEHDDAWYVPKELFSKWEKRDPIARFERYLVERGVMDEAEIDETRQRVADEMDEAQRYAEESPMPKPEQATGGVYAP